MLWHNWGTMSVGTIRKRGNKYHVQIRRIGYSPATRSFTNQTDAKAWERRVETAMDNGSWVDVRDSRSTQIDQIVDDYVASYERFDLVIPTPKLTQLKQIKDYFQQESIHNLTLDSVLDFAAWRRQTVCASTLQTQMYYFQQVANRSGIKTEDDVLEKAIDELRAKKIIMGSKQRDRRLEPGEYELLMDASKGDWLAPAIDIAIESGMRQSEIHRLKWSDIDKDAEVIHLWRKDKHAEGGRSKHKIPLLKGVREALTRHSNLLGQGERLFKVEKAASISDKFAKVRDRLNLEDLRFHDLRHEAISRFFERGMRVEQVRVISGHRTLDQLSRYVNLRAEDIKA